jgi:hypothetical protein
MATSVPSPIPEPSPGRSITLRWGVLFQGITVVSVISGAFAVGIWKGQIDSKLDKMESDIAKLTDVHDGVIPRLDRLETHLKDIDRRLGELESDLRELQSHPGLPTALPKSEKSPELSYYQARLGSISEESHELAYSLMKLSGSCPTSIDNSPVSVKNPSFCAELTAVTNRSISLSRAIYAMLPPSTQTPG